MRWFRDRDSRFRPVFYLISFLGGFSLLFDVLKKTVFLEASWNYTYPDWHFVYDPPVTVLLIVLAIAVVVGYPRLLELSERRFLLSLYGFTAGFFLLVLFALPTKADIAVTPSFRGLYQAAMVFVNEGPLQFFSKFHSLPGYVPDSGTETVIDGNPTNHEGIADRVSEFVRGAGWLPFNDAIAADIDQIVIQKHGPGSVLLVVPFLYLFGDTVAGTTIGTFLLSSLTPLIAFLFYREFYERDVARTVALLVAFAPALVFWTRAGSPVPYDVFTGLYVAATLLLFTRGVNHGETPLLAAAGITFSLAIMTKITALFLLPALAGLVYFYAVRDTLDTEQLGLFAGTAIGTPLVFLAIGYNFLSQLLFTALKILLKDGGGRGEASSGDPRAYLADPLLARLTPVYNARWLSVPLFVLAGVFLWWLVTNRRLRDEVDVYALCMTVSIAPFLLYMLFATGTLSRHMLPYLVPLGFVGAWGLNHVASGGQDEVRTIGRLSLVVTLASLLINM